MPLKLVTGPANSGKAGLILSEYRDRLDEDPYLVVPTFEDVEHYRRELALSGAVFGGNVVRFSWLVRAIARKLSYTPRILGAVECNLVVAHAVRTTKLDVLTQSASTEGFAHAARRLIAELQSSMIEPERLGAALKKWSGSSKGRRQYGDEITSIYARYRAVLDELDSVDNELFAWRVLDQLRNDPAGWGNSPVLFYGFDDFTPVQLEIIELLARKAGVDVTVSLAFEPNHVALRDRAKTAELLEPEADERISLDAITSHYAEQSREALNHLERRIFEDEPQRIDPGEAVHLLAAGGERAEAEAVASEVLQLLRSGTTPDDVAVVYRSPSRYASLIEQVFSGYGIPYSIDWNVPLAHTSLGRGILALIDSALADGSADDLLAYLRTPGKLRQPHLADRLEVEVRQQGADTAAAARAIWEGTEGRWTLEECDRLTAARDRGMQALLDELGAQAGRLFTAPYKRAAHILNVEELDDARTYTAIRGALEELAGLADTEPEVDFTVEDLRRTLEDLPVRLGADPRPGTVRVTDPQSIRARRFQAVFICGLQEGEFPRHSRPDPFLPDKERQELAATSGLALREHERQLDAERYLFYVCLSRPEKQVCLSYRISDEEGNPQVTSFFVEDVKDLFTEELVANATTRGLGEITWEPGSAPTKRELERSLAARGKRSSAKPIASLVDPGVLEDLKQRNRFSAGALEAFTECPVKWLVDKMLNPQTLEPDGVALVRGSYAHAVLEATLTGLREKTGSARVTEATLEQAEKLLVEAIREKQAEFQITPNRTRARVEVRRLEFELLRFLGFESRSETSLEPKYFELAFGIGDSEKPALELTAEGISLNGRIDRVDTANGKALVRDYKGKSADPVAKWEGERRLQVAIYMLAVRELLGLELLGGVYQPVRSTDPRGRGLLLDTPEARQVLDEDGYGRNDWRAPAEFEQQLETAKRIAVEVVEELKTGKLQPCPATCAWDDSGCTYPTICRSEGT